MFKMSLRPPQICHCEHIRCAQCKLREAPARLPRPPHPPRVLAVEYSRWQSPRYTCRQWRRLLRRSAPRNDTPERLREIEASVPGARSRYRAGSRWGRGRSSFCRKQPEGQGGGFLKLFLSRQRPRCPIASSEFCQSLCPFSHRARWVQGYVLLKELDTFLSQQSACDFGNLVARYVILFSDPRLD